MRLAAEHAERVKGTTYPNPPVGAVILDARGEVAGVGATEPPGGPHAEVVALRRAAGRIALGDDLQATLQEIVRQARAASTAQEKPAARTAPG